MRAAQPLFVLGLALLLGVATAWAGPAQDIVSMKAGVPLTGDEVPGLLEGGEIMDRLGVVRDELVSGVPEVGREGMKALVRRIDRLRDKGPAALPDSYRAGGDLWLPVKAVRVRILLDAPNLLPRPRDEEEGGRVGNLKTRGVRIDWLPLLRTRTLLDKSLQDPAASEGGGGRPLIRLEEALGGVQQTVRFNQSALIDAYYAVQHALAAERPWSHQVRVGLRRAAQALYEADGPGDLPDQVQAVADALDPDTGTLLDTARALRERIETDASKEGVGDGAAAPTAAPAAGTIPTRTSGRSGRRREPESTTNVEQKVRTP
ncbi:MAG: hypothetical protein WCA32_00100 [Chromatiaceae bacterium]